MLKRKENNNKKDRKSQLLIVGSLLILIGVSVIVGKLFIDMKKDDLENIALIEFYEEQEEIKQTPPAETNEEKQEEIKSTKPLDYVAV